MIFLHLFYWGGSSEDRKQRGLRALLIIGLLANCQHLLGADNPIKWRSKGLTVSTQGNVINLEDEVEIKQGNLRVQANTARIYFNDTQRKVGRAAITKVELQGQVRFIFGSGTEKISGSCDRAELLPQESIVLSGRAQAKRGGNTIRGTKIIYYLHTGWIKVTEAEGVIRSERE